MSEKTSSRSPGRARASRVRRRSAGGRAASASPRRSRWCERFDPEEAIAWRAAGVTSPGEARSWRIAGVERGRGGRAGATRASASPRRRRGTSSSTRSRRRRSSRPRARPRARASAASASSSCRRRRRPTWREARAAGFGRIGRGGPRVRPAAVHAADRKLPAASHAQLLSRQWFDDEALTWAELGIDAADARPGRSSASSPAEAKRLANGGPDAGRDHARVVGGRHSGGRGRGMARRGPHPRGSRRASRQGHHRRARRRHARPARPDE